MTDNYDDIINLPHHVSKNHPQMSMQNRAVQFAPFAALNGHEEAIREGARLTEIWDNDPTRLSALNNKFITLQQHIQQRPIVRIKYFSPDTKKEGGSYAFVSGVVKAINENEAKIIMADGHSIMLAMVADIQGDIFE